MNKKFLVIVYLNNIFLLLSVLPLFIKGMIYKKKEKKKGAKQDEQCTMILFNLLQVFLFLIH